MRLWTVPVALAIVLIAGVAFAVAARTSEEAPVAEAAEYVAGLKRAPGTWQAPTLDVRSGAELGSPDVTIDITAQRTTFIPWEIRVKKGQVVRLRIEGLDNGLADMPGVEDLIGLQEFSGHGFEILGPYDVWITGIRKGVTREVTFVASTPGEFPIECTVFCAPTHYQMQGTLFVEE